MKHMTLLLFSCIASFIFGQTHYTIDARQASWTPNNLTIDVGDSVTWINDNNGTHNVNGTQEYFQYNPESFGLMVTGTNWTYTHQFQNPGTYSFRCDMFPSTMTGTIVVREPMGIDENETEDFGLSPNPAENSISIQTDWTNYDLNIYDALGQKVLSKRMNEEYVLDISGLRSGIYFAEITSNMCVLQQRLLKN